MIFKVDETFNSVSFGKAGDQSVPVLISAPHKVVGDPYIQDPVGRACHDVNVTTGHTRMMKHVDGRDKPGHDDADRSPKNQPVQRRKDGDGDGDAER